MHRSKRMTEASKLVDRTKEYQLEDALKVLKSAPKTKFDESVDVYIRLGVDPKKSDQMVRGSVALPNGLSKKVREKRFIIWAMCDGPTQGSMLTRNRGTKKSVVLSAITIRFFSFLF